MRAWAARVPARVSAAGPSVRKRPWERAPSQGPAPPFRTQAVVTQAQWGRRMQPPITQIQCRDEGLSFFYDRHYETEDRVLAQRSLSPHQRSDRRDGGHPPESGRREVQ